MQDPIRNTEKSARCRIRARGTGRRAHPRMPFSVPFTVRYLDSEGFKQSRGIMTDISDGGIGAIMKTAIGVGSMVELNIPLADAKVRAIAVVRHSNSGRSGFEFVGLGENEGASPGAVCPRSMAAVAG